jgi:hypothetical protein
MGSMGFWLPPPSQPSQRPANAIGARSRRRMRKECGLGIILVDRRSAWIISQDGRPAR